MEPWPRQYKDVYKVVKPHGICVDREAVITDDGEIPELMWVGIQETQTQSKKPAVGASLRTGNDAFTCA